MSEEKYIMWFYQKRAMIKTSEVSIPFFQCLTIFVTMETKVVLNATTPLPAVGGWKCLGVKEKMVGWLWVRLE